MRACSPRSSKLASLCEAGGTAASRGQLAQSQTTDKQTRVLMCCTHPAHSTTTDSVRVVLTDHGC